MKQEQFLNLATAEEALKKFRDAVKPSPLGEEVLSPPPWDGVGMFSPRGWGGGGAFPSPEEAWSWPWLGHGLAMAW